MHESLLINIAIAVLFLPLLGFVVTLLLGKKIKSVFIFENLIITVSFIAAVYLLFSKLSFFPDKNIVAEFEWFGFGIIPFFGEVSV
ncbi:MAG TPA: hypothetical protein VK870_13095, partial [Ignavibacteriaceae bacterium]|nr:hypothetical protein [Ignavibacteriaceae bacterium]